MPRGRQVDLTGKKFNRLVALRQEGKRGTHYTWVCRCDCGSETSVRASDLTSGAIKSCGCLVKETSRVIGSKVLTTHGRSASRVYRIWLAMRSRCSRKSNAQYKDYGGRGITVCDRWLSFENFLADMGEPPSSEHTIERRDNDGPYTPENCRWATRGEQANNKRTSHFITHDGQTLTLTQWSMKLGIPPMTIWNRLRRGWTVADALNGKGIEDGE